MEIWKDIKGYEGMYQVSNNGLVKSLDRMVKFRGTEVPKRQEGRILKPGISKGYKKVVLMKDGERRNFSVHRLVANAHISKTSDGYDTVNHLDGDKLNNNATNLEWCSVYGNTIHAIDNGLKPVGSKHYLAKLTEEKVGCIRRMKVTGFTYNELSMLFNVSKSTIKSIVARRTWKHVI